MNKQFINYNGNFFFTDEAIMTAGNRGLKYADGLFESMRFSKGKLKFADFHSNRLQKGMKALRLEGYSQLNSYFLQEKAEELCRRNKFPQNARLRLYTPTENKYAYVLEATPLTCSNYELNVKGLIMDVFEDIPKAINILSNYKTCNALLYVMAGIFKEQRKLDEAFILNQNGFLCESVSSNVFVVYQKKLYTPALSEGCIAGVMRQVIMDIAKSNNIEMIEAQINPALLNEADEVFLTNASKGIQWVMGINRKRYFNEMSRFLIEKLNQL